MEKYAFFDQPIFKSISTDLHRRYYLKGDFGQSISLNKYSDIEKEPLRQLLGITLIQWASKKHVRIKIFEKALLESSIHWKLEELICYSVGPLILKSEEEEQKQQQYLLFIQQLKKVHPMFEQILSESQLLGWFDHGETSIKCFEQVKLAMDQLPKEYTRLPVFSYKITGDAHAFDIEKPAGRLLLQILSGQLKTDVVMLDNFSEVEMKNYILNEFFLLRDDINNYVTIRGLVGFKDNDLSQMWHHACLENCSWNVPLKEILRMDEIKPMNKQPVLIVENSGIYSILIDHFPDVPMVCSSGQFSYAVWQLLRKFEAVHQPFLYVGDMDPEGLLMAQKLLNTFPEIASTIGMTVINYHVAKKSIVLSDSRIKKLKGVTDPVLHSVAEEISKTGEVAYQEGFLEVLIEQIESYYL